MDLVDTHCHIQFPEYASEAVVKRVIKSASEVGVTKLICVGCTLEDSRLAIEVASQYEAVWASVGLHPHEAQHYINDEVKLKEFTNLVSHPKVQAIGECGLDYFYHHSAEVDQKKILNFQIELALKCNLPLVFHVREAFEDFWKIFDQYKDIKGVIHSFSAKQEQLDQILERDLYVGVNGIATFAKNESQIEAYKAIPLDKMILETDSPFLTPTPYRGTINEPKFLRVIAEFLSNLRGENLDHLSAVTTQNAAQLFNIN